MRALLVDDDLIILEDIRNSLNWGKLGITDVVLASDVETAKQILETEAMDIVVSDIEMPKESGLDLLQWFRERQIPGKFLLLTSYASFEYATRAIKYHAEEYLMKPFHVETMEIILQKMVQELQKEREAAQASALGQWMVSNLRETRLSLLYQLLSGTPSVSSEELMERLRGSKFQIDPNAEYSLVITKVTDLEQDWELYGRNVVSFILTNIQSDVLFENPENENILCYEHRDYYILVAVCPQQDTDTLLQKCREMLRHSAKVLSGTVTCCLMEPCGITAFQEAKNRGVRLLDQCVAFYGEAFLEQQTFKYLKECAPVLEMQQMERLLDAKNKRGFMLYLKKELDVRVKTRMLDARMLESIHREVQQALYSHLAGKGIQISLLVNDPVSERITAKAVQSAADMLRCANYMLDKIFSYEEEIEDSKDLVSEINQFIHLHYRENIGRSEIGAAFYLVPEYLSKLYKKKTGMNLKDYINGYRIEQAKKLLAGGEMPIGEVAVSVGFDNLSYFSTLFKKSSGISPLEYRKQAK